MENNVSTKDQTKKIWSSKKIKIMVSVVYGNLFLGSCYSLMAPIFPAEAERKQASPTTYGLVFAVYQLTMFLAAPVYGQIIPIMKPGFMMKAGMFVSGVCNILFGFLNHAAPGATFIILAAAIRCVDALGASAFLTASYTTVGMELPDVIGRAMSIIETSFALGLAGGPALGGFLFEIGGFNLPFTVIGCLLLAGTLVNVFLFTDIAEKFSDESHDAKKLLKDIDFLIDIIAVCSCFAIIGFNEATLEPHIRQFGLSAAITGVIFLISGITDAISSFFWGYIAEKLPNAQYITFVGCLLYIICFLIVGPVSFLNFPTTLWVVILSQLFFGLGMGAEIVSSFTHGMKHSVDTGFPNNVSTYSFVSSILFSSACFGAFVGPSVGGYMIDHIGYIKSTEAIVGLKSLVAFICIFRLIYLCSRRSQHAETQPLKQCQANQTYL